MGLYINPPKADKLKWLLDHGTIIIFPPSRHLNDDDEIAVCLVDNGAFTAAAVAYSEHELAVFTREDGRPKDWFWVPIDDVCAVTGLSREELLS